ncbi:MAG: hypothetical protein CL832_02130 [Crocinitomicaceae bacterium]|nr:hypothetical protein [Crocinitomicaceae bacterium]|tara:strand:- start:1024 stop:1242 length:219 start_codon:yes stop_codon:yes gene_type:complete
MKKWEYKIEWYGDDFDEEIQEKMNKLGNEGWELVSIKVNPDSIHDRPHLAGHDEFPRFLVKPNTKYFFKREI